MKLLSFSCLILLITTGCATHSVPQRQDPCEERSFDEWFSFYELRDKASSSYPEGYRGAFTWLDSVARACYPDRFDGQDVVEFAEERQRTTVSDEEGLLLHEEQKAEALKINDSYSQGFEAEDQITPFLE